MARKPAHLELKGGRGPRQQIWEVIRRQREDFTRTSIEKATRVDLATITSFLQSLDRAGYIEPTSEPARFIERKHYRLVQDCGVEAPRIDRSGAQVVQSRGTENMWRTMRIMGDFSPRELAMRASTDETTVSVETAKAYARHLTQAGYLIVVEAGHTFIRGKGAKQTTYRLLPAKYTGPRPPMIQRTKTVYDPNLGKVVWQEEPDHDAT